MASTTPPIAVLVGMGIDRAALERRRFGFVLGIDERLGSGLPVGTDQDDEAESR